MSEKRFTILSRPLLVGWTFWLLISWLINMVVLAPNAWTGNIKLTAVRGLLISALTGLVFIWPMLRLAQAPRPNIRRRTLIDIISLSVIFLIVLLILHTQIGHQAHRSGKDWSLFHTFILGSMVIAWTLPVGLGIVIGNGCGVMGRFVVCVMIMVTSIAGLLVVAAGGPIAAAQACPYVLIWRFTGPDGWQHWQPMTGHAIAVAAIGIIGWVAALVAAWSNRSRGTTIS